MNAEIQRVVIVGGGTAGWLSACLLAARRPELAITLMLDEVAHRSRALAAALPKNRSFLQQVRAAPALESLS